MLGVPADVHISYRLRDRVVVVKVTNVVGNLPHILLLEPSVGLRLHIRCPCLHVGQLVVDKLFHCGYRSRTSDDR